MDTLLIRLAFVLIAPSDDSMKETDPADIEIIRFNELNNDFFTW